MVDTTQNTTNAVNPDLMQSAVKNKDLIIDGWFHERGALWPGQAMSLQIEKILDQRQSEY
jgi:spermidine synthase